MDGNPPIPTDHKLDFDENRSLRHIEKIENAPFDGPPTVPLTDVRGHDHGFETAAALKEFNWLFNYNDSDLKTSEFIPANDPDATQPAGTPRMFGRFQVLERLGAGGNGIVFRVFDPKLNRDAALKVPRPDIQWLPGLQRRFLKEAQAAAALDHPNVLPVYDAGQVDGVHFILSAYCAGPSLAQWLAKQKKLNKSVSPQLAANWLMQIVDGVQYSHSKGIAHRDLKPGNIMLEPIRGLSKPDNRSCQNSSPAPYRAQRVNGSGQNYNQRASTSSGSLNASEPDAGDEVYRPRIGDFGLSKSDDQDQSVTVTDAVFGTLAYMAPEQAQGSKNAIAFDIYALGAILFEMLTGRPPLVGQNQIDLLRRIGTEYPPLPSTLRADVPHDLEAICMKCLERDPVQRYQSAADLRQDIEFYLAGERIAAPRIHRSIQYWKPIIQRQLPAWILFGVTGILAIAVTLFSWQSIKVGAESEKLKQTISDIQTSRANERAEFESRSKVAASQEKTLDEIYASDIERANRIWQESRSLERDYPFAAADIKELLLRHVPVPDAIDRRGFEWYYLWRCCEPERFVVPPRRKGTFIGHTGDVYALEFTIDARRLATAGADRTVRIWDVESQKQLRNLVGHTSDVNCVSFSGDGKLLSSASDDGTVKVWDVESGQELNSFTGHQSPVVCVAFHARLPMIYSGDHEGIVKVWDVDKKCEVRSFKAHAKRIQSLFRYPREAVLQANAWRQFLTCGEDYTAKIWDLDQGHDKPFGPHMDFEKNYPLEFFRTACQSPVLATLGYPRTDLSRFEFFRAENPNRFAIENAFRWQTGGFLVDDSEFLMAGHDSPIRSVDIATRKTWKLTEPLSIWSMAVCRDGRHFATGEKGGSVTLWDCTMTSQHVILPESSHIGTLIEFSKDGRWMFVGNQQFVETAEVKIPPCVVWDLTSNPPRACELKGPSPSLHRSRNTLGCFTSDSRELILVSQQENKPYQCRVFDLESLQEKTEFPLCCTDFVHQIVCDDGKIVGRIPFADRIEVFSYLLQNGKQESHFSISLSPRPNALSIDGKWLAIADQQQLSLYDASSGSRIRILEHAITPSFPDVSALSFSPRSQFLAMGGQRGKIRVIDLSDGSVSADFQGETTAAIQAISFSADGQRLVTGGGSSPVVDFWSIPQRSHLLSLRMPGQSRRIRELRYSPDGKRIGATYEFMPLAPALQSGPVNAFALIFWQITGDEAPPMGIASFQSPRTFGTEGHGTKVE